MAIITIKASKATPFEAVKYATDVEKASLIERQNLQSGNEAGQMMDTAKLWGKAQGENDRKYYHLKLSFPPEDWVKHGGTLTEEDALEIGTEIMRHISETAEWLGAVHIDKKHLHFHGIINAVDLESGKLLDMRRGEYARLKDLTQEICAKRGISAIDWRQATKDKRERESQSREAIDETFAEQGLKARGKSTWKDDLRNIIDQAATRCSSMTEFRAALEGQGVILTRCTSSTISYKLGDHRACRGDSLGGDYTAQAIRSALKHNAAREEGKIQEEVPGRKKSLDSKISGAGTKSGYQDQRAKAMLDLASKPITQEERKLLREFGRLAGLKRSEIDQLCDDAPQASWEQKQEVWAAYKAARDEFWAEYAIRQKAIQEEKDALYKLRKELKAAEWALNPRNRRKSLGGMILAAIFIARNDDRLLLEIRLNQLKREQEQLREEMAAFKSATGESLETLREKGLSLDEYMKSVKEMQLQADQIHRENAVALNRDQQKPAKHGNESFAGGGVGSGR